MDAEEFKAKFGMTIHEKAEIMMAKEREECPTPRWWYLSYAHKEQGFRGGAIILAHGFIGACDYARRNRITPGPDVETRGTWIPYGMEPGETFCNRLLTREELESFWGAMATMEEWEASSNAE